MTISSSEDRDGRILDVQWMDPVSGRQGAGTVWVRAGRISFQPPPDAPAQGWTLDGRGRWLAPGLIDAHVHLREPGNEAAETIATGTHAAAAGGFTTVVCMPNTRPPIDTPAAVRHQMERAQEAGFCRVRPSACLTIGRAGETPAPLEVLAEAGAQVFTDDGCTVMADEVMREAMRRARALDRAVMDHAQDSFAEARGCMHEGRVSSRFGVPGIPSSAEAAIIERDIRLARETGCRLHIQHLSSREGVDAVRRAREEGLPVTAEVTPHHLVLCDEDMPGPDPDWKMNPPLRSPADREALERALLEGIVTCLATDHAPHTAAAKARGFQEAPFGVIGLETAVGVTYSHLVASGRMSFLDWLRAWTTGPAAMLGLPPPALVEGAPADLVLLELDTNWTLQPESLKSRSSNTPFKGWPLQGRSVATVLDGRRVAPV
jgi:dihydroorotase